MKWYFYILIASLFYTIQNVYRKKLFNESNISSEKSWSFILIGLLIGVICSLIYVCFIGNIGEIKPKPIDIVSECFKSKNKNINLGFILVGFIILIGMTIVSQSFKYTPNVSYVPVLLGGFTVIFTYITSTIFLKTPIKLIKLMGIIVTLIGSYLIMM
jgi:drug/metabolite transporter (DMT)-like permease